MRTGSTRFSGNASVSVNGAPLSIQVVTLGGTWEPSEASFTPDGPFGADVGGVRSLTATLAVGEITGSIPTGISQSFRGSTHQDLQMPGFRTSFPPFGPTFWTNPAVLSVSAQGQGEYAFNVGGNTVSYSWFDTFIPPGTNPFLTFSAAPVPEPGSMVLTAGGLIALLRIRRRAAADGS